MKEFLKGMARCLDLFGLLDDPIDLPETDEEAFERDRQALQQDWLTVMRDIHGPGWTPENTDELDRS
jgi:hypothetical protein